MAEWECADSKSGLKSSTSHFGPTQPISDPGEVKLSFMSFTLQAVLLISSISLLHLLLPWTLKHPPTKSNTHRHTYSPLSLQLNIQQHANTHSDTHKLKETKHSHSYTPFWSIGRLSWLVSFELGPFFLTLSWVHLCSIKSEPNRH